MLVRHEDGRPMLMDFGAGDFRGAHPLTREVLPPCTPAYLSPEALNFQERFWGRPGAHYKPGPADDIYALGVMAWRLVTGTYPSDPMDSDLSDNEPEAPGPVRLPLEMLAAVSPELARLMLQMLAEEPSARGTAAQLAEAFTEAVRTAGPQADWPIIRHPPPVAIRRRRRSPLARRVRAGWPWLVAAGGYVASLVLVAVLSMRGEQAGRQTATEQAAEEVSWQEHDNDEPDAGTSGLGNEVRTLSSRETGPEPTRSGFGAEVPKKPLPGQARPPCKAREVEINGGCWGRPDVSMPPCSERNYEWRGLCYYPVLAPTPPSTSEPQ